MKKVLKRLLVLTLVATFALGSAGVFAANISEFKGEVLSSNKIEDKINQKKIRKELNLSDKKTLSSVKLTKDNNITWAKTINSKHMAYTTTGKPGYSKYSNVSGNYVIPIKAATTGILYIDAVLDKSSTASIAIISTDINVTAYGASMFLSPGQSRVDTNGFDVVAGKTYYILVEPRSSTNKYTLSVRGYVYANNSRSLSVNKWILSSGAKGSGYSNVYYKIKPSKTGYINVSLKRYGYSSSTGYITLYDSKKKAISSKVYYNSKNSYYNKAYFGVKAKNTYYIRINNCTGSSKYQYKYGVKYSNAKVKDYNISKKSKAKTIKRKKTVSTVFVASTKKTCDWYKIKVSKKRPTVITLNTKGIKSGNIAVTVYKGKKKIGTQKITPYTDKFKGKITYGTSYGKANKGTYYIKVQQGKKCSGMYKIQYSK
ncbi:hypothetical protein [uncultured Anaerofustis sp.]|uniref:hypothetical protein n=1 Tax=uncultured Anaerofustis sp. TaxID=904996 RepID=UPI0025FE4D6E|nr:hypothetical protein [uncultured Anaerofustis sp.]